MDLRSTLNLPDPTFTIPMKADLPRLEPTIQAKWRTEGIYHRIQAAHKDDPSFVLQDGPPYTNSPIHIGTALNKILKDFVIKSRSIMGYRAPYVPGFDNHGLPIEQAVMRKFNEDKIKPSVIELRRACRAHAAKYIAIQSEQFQRLGVFGLWEKPYATMDYGFEAEIIRIFKELVEGGYVYKGLRPTLWSPTSQTALAESEIVYKDHVSRSIYVRFPLLSDPNKLFEKFENVYTIIWTTTPWTIPSNLAVAFQPEFSYAVVKVEGKGGPESDVDETAHYIIADGLVATVAAKLEWTNYTVVERLDGINMDRMEFKHPIFDRPSLAVMADYVTIEDGTGVVHTAPSHGRDDFYTGQKYGLAVPNTVDERGVLTAEAGEFAGVYYKNCDTVVVDRLREVGNLLKFEDFSHSYPHAERDEKPVIFRATEQWFVGMDHDDLRTRMLKEVTPIPLESVADLTPDEFEAGNGVVFVPPTGHARIHSMVGNRPDWCVSRQRPWGVGIPIFYGAESREPVLDAEAIEAVARLVEVEGSDAWFEKEPSEILPAGYKHPVTGETSFVKETDVLDVWFDSGCVAPIVLQGRLHPEWEEKYPADLFLEGSDQHRGWFNSSLTVSTAIGGQAPYKLLVTHGFVTDEQGDKQSKRSGKAIDPVVACETFGADVIRYWVSSVDYANDAPCTNDLLKQVGESYRTVRNTLRFLLGNLEGFTPGSAEPTLDVDRWVRQQTVLLVDDCMASYRRYDFTAVITAVHGFCVKELSRFYLDAVKDRMYCDARDSESRKSGQAACHFVLINLLKLLSPILSHTTEETWLRMREANLLPGEPESIHMSVVNAPTGADLQLIEGNELQVRFGALRGVRENMFIAFEQWKGTDDVKDSQDAIVSISLPKADLEILKTFNIYDLSNFFKVSWIELTEGEPNVSFTKSEYLKCERSRLRRPDVELVDGTPLTKRDRTVIGI